MGARKTDQEKAATLQARRTRERLKRSRASLEAFLFRLESLHADRSGVCLFCYPRTPLLCDEAMPVYRSISQTEREAAAGCGLCIAWLEDAEDARQQVERLRNTRLQEKAADYTGPWIMPIEGMKIGKRREVNYACAGMRDVRVVLAEREAQRRERRAALADLLGVVQDARGRRPWLLET